MGCFGSLHTDAHMRPPVVVKVDKLRNLTFCVLPVLETLRLDIDPLGLDGSVHPLRHGVVGGPVVLRHADGDVVFLEFAHIQVAAVLYSPVRMVDQSFEIVPSRLCDGHPEGFQREEGTERGGKRPAYYFVRIAVGHQMQVAASLVRVDVGYVAYPQTVCRIRDVALYQILPFVVTVVGVGGMPTAGRLSEQFVVAQELQEGISARHPSTPEQVAQHQPQLVTADTRIDRTYLGDDTQDAGLPAKEFLTVRLLLVIGLSAMAKQSASGLDIQAFPLTESRYCLAPDFFRI